MGPWLGLLNAYVTAIIRIFNFMQLEGLKDLISFSCDHLCCVKNLSSHSFLITTYKYVLTYYLVELSLNFSNIILY